MAFEVVQLHITQCLEFSFKAIKRWIKRNQLIRMFRK